MPGSSGGDSIVAVSPTGVLPWHLCRAFRAERAWTIDQNFYAGGEVQSQPVVATSRKRWVITMPLTAAEKAELVAFLEDHNWADPFWFYDVTETAPKYSYDPTGADVTGRYAVRLEGEFRSVLSLGEWKAETSFALIEVS